MGALTRAAVREIGRVHGLASPEYVAAHALSRPGKNPSISTSEHRSPLDALRDAHSALIPNTDQSSRNTVAAIERRFGAAIGFRTTRETRSKTDRELSALLAESLTPTRAREVREDVAADRGLQARVARLKAKLDKPVAQALGTIESSESSESSEFETENTKLSYKLSFLLGNGKVYYRANGSPEDKLTFVTRSFGPDVARIFKQMDFDLKLLANYYGELAKRDQLRELAKTIQSLTPDERWSKVAAIVGDDEMEIYTGDHEVSLDLMGDFDIDDFLSLADSHEIRETTQSERDYVEGKLDEVGIKLIEDLMEEDLAYRKHVASIQRAHARMQGLRGSQSKAPRTRTP